jgi:hypothetical protein
MFPEQEDHVNVSTAEYLWREIMLEEPNTNAWEFACKLWRMGYIAQANIWDTAEWADAIRENVRRLNLPAAGDQTATGSTC